jgi:hypothetical protein
MSAKVLAALVSLLCLAGSAHAEPTADQVLTDAGLSAGDKQSVTGGQFVNVGSSGVSERDLAFAIAFLVKTPPETLAKQISGGQLITADTQVKAYGEITSGTLAELENVKPGDAINLSTAEIATLKKAADGAPAMQEALRKMLLARYQAYKASGLAGIAPYDRGSGRTGDPAADLRKASEATKILAKYLPAFQKMLLDYPKAAAPGVEEKFFWMKSVIQGELTFVLAHVMVAADGGARAAVKREYYVSAGYNAEQTVAGFLPVQGGTVAVSNVHAFTEQVTGMGGSMKRSIGSKVMAGKMKEIYEAGRERSQKQK